MKLRLVGLAVALGVTLGMASPSWADPWKHHRHPSHYDHWRDAPRYYGEGDDVTYVRRGSTVIVEEEPIIIQRRPSVVYVRPAPPPPVYSVDPSPNVNIILPIRLK